MRSIFSFSCFLVLLVSTGILALKVPGNRDRSPTISATSVHKNFRRDEGCSTNDDCPGNQHCGFHPGDGFKTCIDNCVSSDDCDYGSVCIVEGICLVPDDCLDDYDEKRELNIAKPVILDAAIQASSSEEKP